MLNLLNREKRHYIRMEYFGRFINIFLGVIIFSLLFYATLLISSGFLVSFEKESVKNESERLSQITSQKELNEYENKLSRVEVLYNLFSKEIIYPTEIISLIKQKEIEGVFLNTISFQKTDEEGSFKLEINGKAKNRDILLKYLRSIKTELLFKDASVPLSSLTKNSDIPFSYSVISKINKKDEK